MWNQGDNAHRLLCRTQNLAQSWTLSRSSQHHSLLLCLYNTSGWWRGWVNAYPFITSEKVGHLQRRKVCLFIWVFLLAFLSVDFQQLRGSSLSTVSPVAASLDSPSPHPSQLLWSSHLWVFFKFLSVTQETWLKPRECQVWKISTNKPNITVFRTSLEGAWIQLLFLYYYFPVSFAFVFPCSSVILKHSEWINPYEEEIKCQQTEAGLLEFETCVVIWCSWFKHKYTPSSFGLHSPIYIFQLDLNLLVMKSCPVAPCGLSSPPFLFYPLSFA